MRSIAFYGKGGIGKSTTQQNTAAALAYTFGKKVFIHGCDPKADCTRLVLGGTMQKTIMDELREHGVNIQQEEVIKTGFKEIHCVESGGPEPGVGCAGRGIMMSIEWMEKHNAYPVDTDFLFYDVLGDVVCGGFATPIREGKAQEIVIVTSGEMMSVYAANNICKGISKYAELGNGKLAGIVCNCRGVPNEEEIVAEFAESIVSSVLAVIPRSNDIIMAENHRKTVFEDNPDSPVIDAYNQVALKIIDEPVCVVPRPLTQNVLEGLIAR